MCLNAHIMKATFNIYFLKPCQQQFLISALVGTYQEFGTCVLVFSLITKFPSQLIKQNSLTYQISVCLMSKILLLKRYNSHHILEVMKKIITNASVLSFIKCHEKQIHLSYNFQHLIPKSPTFWKDDWSVNNSLYAVGKWHGTASCDTFDPLPSQETK